MKSTSKWLNTKQKFMNTSKHKIQRPTKRLYNIIFIRKFKNNDPILSLVPSHPPIIPPPPPPPPLPFTPIIKYNIYYNKKNANQSWIQHISEIYNTKHHFPVKQNIIQLNSQYYALYNTKKW